MNKKLEMAQDKFMEGIGKLAGSFGLNQFIAQLYAVLYLSNKPLSLDELAERLKASKGNVSVNIRELENWGAVRSVWVKGSRKDYYEADPDIRKVLSDKLRSAAQKRITEVSGMIDNFKKIVDSAEAELTKDERETAKIYKERLQKIEDIKTLMLNALVLVEKLIKI